jgi:hypothetical protein
MIAIIRATDLSEFDKPPDQPPIVNIQSSARVGDVVAVKLMFMGAERDANGRIDLTYDIRILAPDGAVYSGADHKGLPAAQGPIPTDAGVLDNRVAVVAIRFEAKDLPGPYKVEATLHDNIGKRDLPLSASIELLKPPIAAGAALQGS